MKKLLIIPILLLAGCLSNSTTGRYTPSYIGSSAPYYYTDDLEVDRQRRQQRNSQREIENQLRRQTTIMQEQLDNQEAMKRQQSLERMKYQPNYITDTPRRSYPIIAPQIPTTYNNQTQPSGSQFDVFSGKGILDGY